MPGLSIRGGCTPGNSRLGQLAPLVLIKRIAHVRGPVPGLSIRALGSSLPLVLIERIAHVRGPVPGFSIRGAWPHGTNRANGSSLPLVLIKRIAHVRAGGGLALSVA